MIILRSHWIVDAILDHVDAIDAHQLDDITVVTDNHIGIECIATRFVHRNGVAFRRLRVDVVSLSLIATATKQHILAIWSQIGVS